jgi:osomolarity two-component system phosphorelay intermediate protein YPD1
MSPAENKDEKDLKARFGDHIDVDTFEQILEMDEPDDHEFSQSIVFGFFDQAEETFVQIEEALEKKDLPDLSSLGHFLKGSSATLGLAKVRDGCEKMQRYGKKENVDGSPEDDEEICLQRIKEAFEAVKTDYQEVETALREYYESKE